ncbi:MAG: LysM peptidoglycan-binding domain-containing protein [Solirubrobacteraceae bacterium]
MYSRKLLLTLVVAALALVLPTAASAAFDHTIAPGESLYSVAAADGLSVDQLAAANGLSPDSELTAGSSIAIPPQSESATPASDVSSTPGESAIAGSTESAPAESTPTESSATSGGGYLVEPGDTLSAIAARYGTSVDQLASENGLDPAGLLVAGATLSVGGAAASPSAQPVSDASSAPASTGEAPSSGAVPTAETVSPSYVGSVAAENGVSPSLAEAIGEQESGFNNDEVSSTGATGVMQIEPGTWNYIGQTLAVKPPLSPDSAADNVRGGVLLLHSLLDQTGGDPALAAAGYYQGLESVREHGLYSDTQQYVNDVMALQHRFGG